MPGDRRLPKEIVQFESFLKKPNSDPTGFAGFFNSGEIVVTRVPARLDVMGGISRGRFEGIGIGNCFFKRQRKDSPAPVGCQVKGQRNPSQM